MNPPLAAHWFRCRKSLDALYRVYNRRAFVHPDPLEFLYRYEDPLDIEIAGLIASSLAYGRVAQILAGVSRVLGPMGPSPRAFLIRTKERDIAFFYKDFVHRFTRGKEMSGLLIALKKAADADGSLQRLFVRGMGGAPETVLPALAAFVRELRRLSKGGCPGLLPSPEDGSACKRLNLFLRWMVRRDAVDPGPWRALKPSMLVVPLDTHLFRIARSLGMTKRRQPDLKTAMEVTRTFAAIRPEDPVRYDFSLTRLGIMGGGAHTGDNLAGRGGNPP
jgi:uncharacterized protein (TIGR02757 family)